MVIKVAVVEDDALMRLAVVTALKQAGLDVVFEAATGTEAVDQAKKLKPDAAILDLHLGEGPTGIDVAVVLRRQNPKVALLFLTSFEDPRLLSTTLPELPFGSQYLAKSAVTEVGQILASLRAALNFDSENAPTTNLGSLTKTQIEILKLVAAGHSNSEIAKQRFLTEKSVEVSISRIAKALGLKSDATQNQRVHIAQVYFRAVGKQI